jgi:hypothetical protein
MCKFAQLYAYHELFLKSKVSPFIGSSIGGLASKMEIPTLNKIWSFLHDRDFKEMDKIVTKQINLNFDRRKTLRK